MRRGTEATWQRHAVPTWHIYFIYFIYYIYINGSSALPIWEGVIDPLIRRAL